MTRTDSQQLALSGSDRSRDRVVAIVGANSFLGRNLIGLFEESHHIRRAISLDRQRPDTATVKTRHYDLDLATPRAEERLSEILRAEVVDTTVHVGFLATPSHALSFAHELESVGTMHLLNACRRARVRKVVMWSQTALYGAHPTNPNYLTEKHPLRARREEPYFTDKMDAEADALQFGSPGSGRIVTVLRTAPILGPNVQNYITSYLSHRLVPTVLGFDPLWQFAHEADAVSAFRLSVLRDVPGIINIASSGVLPLSKVIKLVGRANVPLPRSLCKAAVAALWTARAAEAPPTFVDYLQYLCVADDARAREDLGFYPLYSSREAVIDFASAQHLREVQLLSEGAA